MATTTNYSWTTPDDTDLVKDGAAAIRTLGSAIDTTVFNNAGAAVAKSLIDAEGDLIVGDAADAVQRLAIGSNGNVLTVDTTVDGKIKWAAPAGGKVLQVVSATYSTEANNSTSTYADTGLTASITPSATASKVLILVSSGSIYRSNANVLNRMSYRLLRGATQIYETEVIYSPGVELKSSHSISYVDSPSTTSSTTYKTQFMNVANAASVGVQNNSTTATITLLEIGA
jgi:hypothetical protein